jgi:molecular chaperone DnaK
LGHAFAISPTEIVALDRNSRLMSHVVGIDLGTTNSVVACLEGDSPVVMQNAEGHKTTPSVVLYSKDDPPVVGELAKRQRLVAPDRAIYSVKRFVGCRWEESEQRRAGIDYNLASGEDGLVHVEVIGRRLLPEQVQAEVLKKMKTTAEDYLGQSIEQAVITCPAYFNDSQRQATKKAAELAGLEALRIINEPTAAALAYGLGKHKSGRIAVFDFGGGTFDVSILEIDGDVFEVKSTCGDTCLGGDTIDQALRVWMLEEIRAQTGLDLSSDPTALTRVAEASERAKCELSTLEKTTLALPFLGADASGPKHYTAELTRAQFEALAGPIFARLEPPCRQAISDSGVALDKIDAVILVGGSSRIPAVRRMVKALFGREPDCSVNPDEAVAIGAAIQAGVIRGDLEEILLLDVTPLSLGIELAGGVFAPLIPRNSNIPTTTRRKFTTVRDNQVSVQVHVLQGERRIAAENRSLARFRLEGILPAPREVPEIEVNFTIDANGILNVAAMDLTTGKMQEIRVESYQPAFDRDAEKEAKAAVARAEEDRAFLRKASVRRRLEDMQLELQAWLDEHAIKGGLGEKQEGRLRQAMFRLDAALESDDFAKIDKAERDLKGTFSEIMMLAGAEIAMDNGDELVFESPHKAATDERKPSEAPRRAPAEEAAPASPPEAPAQDEIVFNPGRQNKD